MCLGRSVAARPVASTTAASFGGSLCTDRGSYLRAAARRKKPADPTTAGQPVQRALLLDSADAGGEVEVARGVAEAACDTPVTGAAVVGAHGAAQMGAAPVHAEASGGAPLGNGEREQASSSGGSGKLGAPQSRTDVAEYAPPRFARTRQRCAGR
jgi:hypothetical protein